MEIDWMEVWTRTSVPLGKQEEMVLDTLVCRCLSFCFPLDYMAARRPASDWGKGLYYRAPAIHTTSVRRPPPPASQEMVEVEVEAEQEQEAEVQPTTSRSWPSMACGGSSGVPRTQRLLSHPALQNGAGDPEMLRLLGPK